MPSSPTQYRSMSFASDSDDMDDASLLSSPPRSCQRTSRLSVEIEGLGISRSTPSSRRLFAVETEKAVPSPPPRSKLESRFAIHRRSSEKQETLHSDSSTPPDPALGRKRSSAERRGDKTPQCKDPHGTDHAMYSSPKMSPNSFITMDGRFVQSKNPFSSPVVTEPEINNAAAARAPPPEEEANAPRLPSFYNNDTVKPVGFLPPRSTVRKTQDHVTPLVPRGGHAGSPAVEPRPTGGILDQSGFPLKRFSFTGSPIQEHQSLEDPSDLMETDTATSGSLHKVRRLYQSDDVVAACGHDLKSRRPHHLSVKTHLEPDTESEISPTDVMNYPPPAPVKAKAPAPVPPYASLRTREPQTPVAERRRRVVAARTPHPGSLVNGTEKKPSGPRSRFYTDFDVLAHLGKGSFGTVYKVLSRLDGCMYAIKVAERKAKGVADRDRMLKEVYALATLSDQADTATFHIVRYHQAWMADDRLYIQTELCTGTLAEEVAKGPLAPNRLYKLLRELCIALDFVHRNNMVHLDIKKENVFLKNDQFKLGDFGLVTLSSEKDVEEGDSRYMSMELLSGDHADLTKSDIFSLGATMYEICLGRELPMNGDEWQNIRAGRLAPLNAEPVMVELIHSMMQPDPSKRPTANELLQHEKLLSDEQKALVAERSKVRVANMQLQLAAQAKFQTIPPTVGPPRKGGLTRANTWNGSSLPHL